MTQQANLPPRVTNSFDEMRFILAMIVVFGHATQLSSNAPLRSFAYIFDTHVAVSGFFAVSGYLVTKSYLSSTGLRDYFGKRLRRIYPAYVGVILFCFGIGALTTSLPLATFVTYPETWRYLAANLSLMNFLQPSLPGALQDNHLTALNGSLWTIKVEVMLYFTVPFLRLFYRGLGHAVTLALCLAGALMWYLYFTYYFGHPLGPTIGTVALTLIIALLSWHMIEKRFLRRGSHYIMVAQG